MEKGQTVLKKIHKEEQGSAMILTVIVMMVLFVLSLSMLLAAYSFHHLATSGIQKEQVKELVKTLNLRLEDDLCVTFSSKAEEDSQKAQHPFWSFIRENMKNEIWPYHSEEEWGHEGVYTYREFQVNIPEIRQENFVVRMAWEPGEAEDNKSGALLEVEVSCQEGSEYARLTSVYELQQDTYGSGEEKWTWKLSERN